MCIESIIIIENKETCVTEIKMDDTHICIFVCDETRLWK